jgi:zinc transport system substrate-binding protein
MSFVTKVPAYALAGLVALSLSACGGSEDGSEAPAETVVAADAGPRLTVLTVNYPLAYFAQRLGGDRVDARYPGPAEGDPANWSPTPEDVIAFQDADLILLNGAEYAGWVARVTLPEDRLVNTSEAFADAYIVEEAGVTHSHGPEGEHAHGVTAFTTWLDLSQATQQAEAVAEALVAALPEAEAEIRSAFDALVLDLADLDGRLTGWGLAMEGAPIIASHPVYQYFGRAYALNLQSVHWEPGEMPSDAQWRDFHHLLDHDAAELMIWEGEPLPEVRSRLEGMGVTVVVFDPVSTVPESGDFLSVMRANVAALGAGGP